MTAVSIYAGFWRRVAASLIDMALFTALLLALLGADYAFADTFSREGLVTWGLSLLVTVVLWVKFLGTPGKLLLGCQVVDAVTLKALGSRQAVLRNLAYIVSMLPLGAGFLVIAWHPRKQGWHDRIAGSVVLHNAGVEHDDESRKSLRQLMREVR